jgi:hypothetical protein
MYINGLQRCGPFLFLAFGGKVPTQSLLCGNSDALPLRWSQMARIAFIRG